MTMYIKSIAFIFIYTLVSFHCEGQKYDLSQCIDFGIENSLQIQQANYNVRNSEITRQLSVESRYPSLNFTSSLGGNYGRTIDPTTNTFVVSSLYTNGFSINSGFVLYNGNRINNTIKQARIDVDVAKKEREQAMNDLSLAIAQAYLNLLLAYDNFEAAEANLELTRQQLDQTQKLVDAGALPLADLLEVESQLAINEQDIVNANNNIILGKLELKQLMFMEPSTELEIVRPQLDNELEPPVIDPGEVFSAALQTQPEVAASELRIESAIKGEDIAKARWYPTISTFAQMNTNYSSIARTPTGFDIIQSPPTPVIIDGETSVIQFFQEVPTFDNQPYFDQLDRNLGFGLGIQVSMPLYNNGQTRLGVERARLNKYNTDLEFEQTKLQIKNDVERATADANAAWKSLMASNKALRAAERVLQDAGNRLAAGVINSFEYTNAKTRYDNAIINQLLAKYEYIFRLKVIDFYLGNPLQL